MNTNINYIINTWNLSQIQNIDLKKSNITNLTGTPIFHLYLLSNNVICPYCGSSYFYVRSTKNQSIKHVLSNQSYAEIVFHKYIKIERGAISMNRMNW